MDNKHLNYREIIWLAVHPTPYNYYLYSSFKRNWRTRIEIFFASKTNPQLPFQEKYYDTEDRFFNETFGVDSRVLKKVFDKKAFFVFVGWNSRTKMFGIVTRMLFKLPYGIWTDSVNPASYQNKSVWTRLRKAILNRASIVMTTGEFGIKKMREVGVTNPNVVSLPFFVPVPENVLPRKINPNQKIKILIISRLIQRKGVLTGIKAIEKVIESGFDNVELNICGIGEEKEVLVQYIRDANLLAHVHLKGWQNHGQLSNLMRESHILLHPILEHDPYPLVILESISYGLPVIGNNFAGSVMDNIKHNYNGFIVRPGSVDEMATSILKLFENPALIFEMSNNSIGVSKQWNVDTKSIEIEEKIRTSF